MATDEIIRILNTYGEVELKPGGKMRMWSNKHEGNRGFAMNYRSIEDMHMDIQSVMLACTKVIEKQR
jgi:hypothetical protein